MFYFFSDVFRKDICTMDFQILINNLPLGMPIYWMIIQAT
jgi:hypothetical protein